MMTPEYSHEQIIAFAQSALAQMARRHIAPTPHNFHLWYNYVSSGNVTLVDEIDKAEAKGVKLDEGMNSYLYNKFIASGESPETKAQQNAKHLLADILNTIADFSGETKSYQDQMDTHISSLESSESEGDVKSMVAKIISATKELKSGSEQLGKKLDESRKEVEGLKQNLVQATNEAQRDFLTGVFNRKALDKMLDELSAFADEQKAPLSMLMIDVDHFKKFNDVHGHLIGDEVLKTVARILTDTLKGRDIVARYGGEEFAVLLPSTELKNAATVAEILRQSVASKELKRKDTGKIIGKITVSIGVSTWHHASDSVPVFIKRADDALYAAKNSGRNRVSSESPAQAA